MKFLKYFNTLENLWQVDAILDRDAPFDRVFGIERLDDCVENVLYFDKGAIGIIDVQTKLRFKAIE